MTPDEARDHLAVIRGVVERARAERMRGGDIYVVWGVVLVVCAVLTLAGDAVGFHWGWVSYPVLGTLAGLWTAWTARARGLSRDTYGTRIEGTAWASVGAAIGVLLGCGLGSGVLPLEAVIPVVCSLVGVGQCTASTVYKSRMLGWSGACFVALAGVCFWFSWQAQYALFAVAVVFGYIVPGLVMLRQERSAG